MVEGQGHQLVLVTDQNLVNFLYETLTRILLLLLCLISSYIPVEEKNTVTCGKQEMCASQNMPVHI